MNINTLSVGVKGAMIWGLGFALFEEVQIDGHRSHTEAMSDYRIPRFADVPRSKLCFSTTMRLARHAAAARSPFRRP